MQLCVLSQISAVNIQANFFLSIQTVVTTLQFNLGDLPIDCERVTRHIKKHDT